MLGSMTELETWLADDLRATLAARGASDLAGAVGGLTLGALWNCRARAREMMIERLRARGLPAADSDALWLGWSGPLAADTRAELILTDLARLERLLDDPMQAVRLLIVGEARDEHGQALADRLTELAGSARFEGRLLFIASLDPSAKALVVQGVDLWLDTALGPSSVDADEASAPPSLGDWAMANGALGLSTSTRPGASWTITSAEPFDDRSARDDYDARRLYERLEGEVVPSFYDWNTQAIPARWVERVRASLRAGLLALT